MLTLVELIFHALYITMLLRAGLIGKRMTTDECELSLPSMHANFASAPNLLDHDRIIRIAITSLLACLEDVEQDRG